jgi:ribose transport system permease protein
MKRLLGILLMVVVLYVVFITSPGAMSVGAHQDIANWLGYYGIVTVGVGILIISGGIDLSIGSVVGLGSVCFSLLLHDGYAPLTATVLVVLGGAVIGLLHGVLVTKLRLQPFLVTLCGLFIYRGLARWLIGGESIGIMKHTDTAYLKALESFQQLLVKGSVFGIKNQLLELIVISIVLGLFLHGTKYGRYLYAIGANEEAARYAGIATDYYKILAYIICSTLAGFASVLFILDNATADPVSAGSWLELYAITGAVLGGCSLRGGEGSVLGMVFGAAIMPLLRQICSFRDISPEIEYSVIGAFLLIGTVADELIKRGFGRLVRRWFLILMFGVVGLITDELIKRREARRK